MPLFCAWGDGAGLQRHPSEFASSWRLGRLLERPPELVLSRNQPWPQPGPDVFYSGTVSAAMEGPPLRVAGPGVSSACFQWRPISAPAAP